MSNPVYVNVNKIENVQTHEIDYSIDIHDSYNHGCFHIEEDYLPSTDIDALQFLKYNQIAADKNVIDLLDNIEEEEKSVYINSTLYLWEEIKHLF